jgi:hypothetical protein
MPIIIHIVSPAIIYFYLTHTWIIDADLSVRIWPQTRSTYYYYHYTQGKRSLLSFCILLISPYYYEIITNGKDTIRQYSKWKALLIP